MDERTLTARFKSWIDQALAAGTYLPIDAADVETHPGDDRRRHDLVLRAGDQTVFTAEFKLPTDRHGSSPFDLAVVRPARDKAIAEGVDFYGTSNCSSFVVWRSDLRGVPLQRSYVRRWRVVAPENLTTLGGSDATREFTEFVPKLLASLRDLVTGGEAAEVGVEEEQLVELLEDRLWVIVGLTLPAVAHAFSDDAPFRRGLKAWMLNDQGWTWDDTQADALLLRATQVGCYLLMNQLLFYEAMRRVFPELPTLNVSAATSGEGLSARLRPAFECAMNESRDYESVFDVGFVTDLAFKSDAAVPAWIGLVGGVQDVDLAQYSTDLLGGVFERLLSPEERHRFGQHYTSPELADILLAASVRDASETVFDPAAGGGTFLVRAYDRLRHLGQSDHLVLLGRLYGNDLSRFAAHLSTINLAVRSLAREENYPRVGAHDFLRLEPSTELVRLPLHGREARVVRTPASVDVVIGNPPYVKRRTISRGQLAAAQRSIAVSAARPNLHGLSDLHAYFWPQAAKYLAEGGRLAFLTSSSWLDSTSGESLKSYLKANFRIRAIVGSDVEPWFSGARVATVATVLEREPDEEKRDSSQITFARIQRPLAALLGPRESPERWPSAERIASHLLGGEAVDGVASVRILQANLEPSESWARYLRASEIFERFVSLPHTVRLTEGFNVTVGPKLGNAKWFVVKDIGDSVRDGVLSEHGLTRKSIQGAAAPYVFVEGYLSWQGPIERRFLRRAARGPKVQDQRVLRPDDGDLVVMVARGARVRGTRLAKYIEWAEAHGVHKTYYVSHRSVWYSVEDRPRGPIIMPSSAAFAWKVWENPGSRHMTTSPNASIEPPEGIPVAAALALLNSTWVYLGAAQAASQVGVEGVMRFGGLRQYQELRFVDPRRFTQSQLARLEGLWSEMRRQPVRDFPPEGDEPLTGWRRELDELTIQAAGASDAVEASELVDRLYAWLRTDIGRRADVEGLALAGRRHGSRSSGVGRLAEQTVEALDLRLPLPTPTPFGWTVFRPPAAVSVGNQAVLFGPDNRSEGPCDVRFGDDWVEFDTEDQAGFVRTLGSLGVVSGPILVPGALDARVWREMLRDWVAELPRRVADELSERIPKADARFDEALTLAIALAAQRLRTQMDVLVARYEAESE